MVFLREVPQTTLSPTMVLKVMPYHRRGMSMRPIHRIKHVIDSSATLAKATTSFFTLVQTVDAPVLATTTQVETGAKVNGFYIRFEVASNDPIDLGAIPNFYFYVWKNPGGAITRLTPSSIGDDVNKNKVIHQEMTMFENKGQGGNARTVFNGVVVVPKGMRRCSPADKWEVVFLSPSLDVAVCMQAHYKEFR